MVQEKMSFKDFLSGALAVLLFCAAEPVMQFWKRASWGIFMWSYMKFWPVVQKAISFKDISYLELWKPLCSADPNYLCNFDRRYHQIQWNYFEFGPVVQEEMQFKCISYLDIWQTFGSAECNHMCNFARGYYEEQILACGSGADVV